MNDDEQKIYDELMPSKEKLEEADKHLGIITLIQGTLDDGSEFYSYVAIPPSKYEAFRLAQDKGGYMISDFGEILRSGDGKEPSQQVIKEMAEEYGTNHNFESEIMQAMQDSAKEIQKQEKEKELRKKYHIDDN